MTQPFFPNQPQAVLEAEARFRAEAARLPDASRLVLYEVFSRVCPTCTPTTFHETPDTVLARQASSEIVFPRPLPLIKLSLVIYGYAEWLRRKYALPGFVEVEAGDIVIDCGAYVGGFTLGVASIAGAIHAFEPEDRNFACLQQNVEGYSNVVANACGLYSTTGRMPLNISNSSVEHSLLLPDDGCISMVEEVEMLALADYLRQCGLKRLDFLKIEAEGVEPEVFDGLEDVKPRKLAIDVSPERNGKSPSAELEARLVPLGYEVRQRGHVMFARLDPS